MKKSLRNFLILFLLLIGCVNLRFNILTAKAENLLPQIAFVGLDHYPLLEGETDTVYLTSKDYSGKVQYQIFMTKDEGEWYPLTDYLPAVDASTPFEYSIPQVFSKGNYRMAIRVKRADSSGAYANQYGAYDSAYPFSIECVQNNIEEQIKAKGEIVTDKEQYGLGETVKVSEIKGIDGLKSPYLYKLNVYDPSQNMWTNMDSGYTSNPEWKPSSTGKYILDLWVKSSKESGQEYEAWKLKVIDVNEISNDLKVVSVEDINNLVLQNEVCSLPTKLTATISDGSQKDLNVIWNTDVVDTTKAGTYVFEGTIQGYSKKVKYTLNVTDDSKKILYDIILNGMLNLSDEVNVLNYVKSQEDISKTFKAVLDEHPEIFYVNQDESVYYPTIGRITIKYRYSKSQIGDMKNLLDKKVEEIINKYIKPGISDYEKELAVHDYIVLNSVYDSENVKKNTIEPVSHTAYGLLINKIGVCDGYARAVMLILNKVGVETKYVEGTADGVSHGWNIVKIDGKYYQLDPTWDDPTPNVEGYVSHAYFNITDEEIAKDHIMNNNNYPKCTSTQANYFIKSNLVANNYNEFCNMVKQGIINRKTLMQFKVNNYNENVYKNVIADISRENPNLRNIINYDTSNYSYSAKQNIISFNIKYR